MKRLAFFALGAALLMTAGAPAQAECVSARLFTTGNSYIYTPGYESGGGFMNTSVSADFQGAFWAIGSGNLADPLAGNDNGTFPALGGWLGIDPGYPAYIDNNWASSTDINGCIDAGDGAETGTLCMAILLMDNDANTGTGAFALLTDLQDNLKNFNFEQPGEGPINLVTVPGLTITGSVRTNSCALTTDAVCDTSADCPIDPATTENEPCVDGTGVDVTVGGLSLSSIEAGLYLDPDCPAPTGAPGEPAAIEGYLVFARELPRGAQPPTDTATEGWGDPVSDVIPLGDPATVSLDCTGDTDQYLAAGVVFDSGSVSEYVTGPTTRFECGANLADPEEEILRKPRNRERPRSRSRGR